jgi:hypothetical protein
MCTLSSSAHKCSTHAGSSDRLVALRTVCYPRRQNGHVTMKRMEMQAVLTSMVADFVMRSKLTLWRHPTAKVNGGWCLCLTKQEIEDEKACLQNSSNFVHQNSFRLRLMSCMVHSYSSYHDQISRVVLSVYSRTSPGQGASCCHSFTL